MEQRNLTLKLDADLYKEVKVLAAKRDTSISALVADKLTELVEEESGYAAAQVRALSLLEQGFALGTKGKVTWSRDALHER